MNFDGGVHDNTKDTCRGDSGGPLICEQSGIPVIYGIASYGPAGCDSYTIFTKVAALSDWIYQTALINSVTTTQAPSTTPSPTNPPPTNPPEVEFESGPDSIPNDLSCPNPAVPISRINKIIGGNLISREQSWPWIVKVPGCSGSIISRNPIGQNDWILTGSFLFYKNHFLSF